MARSPRSHGALAALALLVVGAITADVARRALRDDPSTPPVPARGSSSAGGATAPARDSSAVARAARARARIALEGNDTYLSETLLETDSTVRRWPDRRLDQPLQVAVVPAPVPGYQDAFAGNVAWALDRWNGFLPIAFATGADSAAADVVVTWTPQLDSAKTGRTDLTWDANGNIHHAVVTLATHDANGRPLDAQRMGALALHEFGHVLGLGHSAVRADALFPIATARELTDRDRRTARLLYDLPPGSLR